MKKDSATRNFVRLDGNAPRQAHPVAMLSYYLFPVRGKVFTESWKGRKCRHKAFRYADQDSIAVALGLGLDVPLEKLFFGASTEPLPGVSVTTGVAPEYRNARDASRDANAFVLGSKTPNPVPKRRSEARLARAASIDPAPALGAFEKLVGLK